VTKEWHQTGSVTATGLDDVFTGLYTRQKRT